jgi:hypothetical protein
MTDGSPIVKPEHGLISYSISHSSCLVKLTLELFNLRVSFLGLCLCFLELISLPLVVHSDSSE